MGYSIDVRETSVGAVPARVLHQEGEYGDPDHLPFEKVIDSLRVSAHRCLHSSLLTFPSPLFTPYLSPLPSPPPFPSKGARRGAGLLRPHHPPALLRLPPARGVRSAVAKASRGRQGEVSPRAAAEAARDWPPRAGLLAGACVLLPRALTSPLLLLPHALTSPLLLLHSSNRDPLSR